MKKSYIFSVCKANSIGFEFLDKKHQQHTPGFLQEAGTRKISSQRSNNNQKL